VDVPVRILGLPRDYLPHASRGDLLARHGLDAAGIAEATLTALTRTTARTEASA
jgi:1-deoxy-D-xylulose-5-phosphate synthase